MARWGYEQRLDCLMEIINDHLPDGVPGEILETMRAAIDDDGWLLREGC